MSTLQCEALVSASVFSGDSTMLDELTDFSCLFIILFARVFFFLNTNLNDVDLLHNNYMHAVYFLQWKQCCHV